MNVNTDPLPVGSTLIFKSSINKPINEDVIIVRQRKENGDIKRPDEIRKEVQQCKQYLMNKDK